MKLEPSSRARLLITCSGEVVSVRRQLICSKVLPALLKSGEACILAVEDFITEDSKDDLMNPKRCLLPESEWPKVPPKSKVHASDGEWYSLVTEGFARGIVGDVSYEQVLRIQMANRCSMELWESISLK